MTTLTWTSQNASSVEIGPSVYSGPDTGGSIDLRPTQTRVYYIKAYSPDNLEYDTATVTVTMLPIEVSMTADQIMIQSGGSTNLNWASTNADSCVIQPGVGPVGLNGSINVSPTTTTYYRITATNSGQSATANAMIFVSDSPPPQVSIIADHEEIGNGQSSILSYTSSNASLLRLEPGNMPLEIPSGTVSVSPTETTTYEIIAYIQDESIIDLATDSATVTVSDLPVPQVTFDASPESINQGQSSLLTWSAINTDSVTIEPGIYSGSDIEGSVRVWPTEIMTYTITATGPNGSITEAVTVVVTEPMLPTVNFSAAPALIQPYESCTLTWTSSDADYCAIYPDVGSFGPDGTIKVYPSTTTTYTIIAFGQDGYFSETVTVTVEGNSLPRVNITAESESICYPAIYSTLTWSSGAADSCTIVPDIGTVNLSGSLLVSPTETTTYTITAINSEGTASKDVTVYVCESPPTVASISADPYTIYKGEKTYIRWGATNTNPGYSCTLLPENIVSNGTPYGMNFYPTETTTYTVTAEGPMGTDSDRVTVIVIDPPTQLTISAEPANVLKGHSSIITWDSSDISTCVIEPDIGIVGASGSVEVWPIENTIYTITVNGPTGPYSKNVSVNIIPPTAAIWAIPENILPGETSVLSWNSAYADSCEITPDIGFVDFSGSIEVSPAQSTIYTIKALNAGGNKYASTSVHIMNPPTVDIWVSGSSVIQPGRSTSLTYRSNDADSLAIEPDIGGVRGPNGSIFNLSPAETTAYTITATNSLGSYSDTCVVGVANSSTFEVFPSTQFLRTGGKANVYEETFSANPGEGRLIIKNGSADGGFRLTEATVLLNGIEIFSPSDFSESVYQLQQTVAFEAHNTLTIKLKKGVADSYLTAQATQEQTPTVNISADQTTIYKGEQTTLIWSSANAYVCHLDQGISNVMPNGSISISPAQTTKYMVTATGTGGTATDSVTIVVVDPPPAVSISAVPNAMQWGEESTLTWQSTNANSCFIEPDVGSVDISGSITVIPTENTTYTITASGAGGDSAASAEIRVISPIALQATCPLNGSALSARHALVSGSVTNSSGNETGVLVNGVPAFMFDSQFFINHLPLEDGTNTINVVATDSAGAQVVQEIIVIADLPGDYILLNATQESGLAPLELELFVSGTFSLTAQAEITCSGPGSISIFENSIDRFKMILTTPGIYYLTASAMDQEGATYTDTIVIIVLEQNMIDTIFRNKWNGMINALVCGDTVAASEYFTYDIRDKYKSSFDLLKDYLPEIMSGLYDFQLVEISEYEAEYSVLGDQDGQIFSFYVLFIRDSDGIWRIRFF
jgi:hypothetical protein